MYDNTKEFVQAVRILGIVHGVEQPELERESDAISKLNILPDIFLILEALEMKGEYIWQLLDFHPAMTKRISIGAGDVKHMTHRFSASCKSQQASQKNLFL